MADTWFSLHCSNVQGPIYVSEIVDRAMNPNFRFFDLNVYGPAVTRQDGLIFRFWAKAGSMEGFTLLIEIQLCLRSLQFIGKSVCNSNVIQRAISDPMPHSLRIFITLSLKIVYSSIFLMVYTQVSQIFRWRSLYWLYRMLQIRAQQFNQRLRSMP